MASSPACRRLDSALAAVVVLVLGSSALPAAAHGGDGEQHVRRRLAPCTAPVIVTQPDSSVVRSGESVTLGVVASSVAEPSYQWYTGSSGETSAPIAGATGRSFTTPSRSVTASYWVRVTSDCGSADSAAATVTVCDGPAITTQPASRTIPSGEATTLTVAATGLAPLACQWYRGAAGDTSAPVGADSPSFTTPVLDATTRYWVRISSWCGRADSVTARVTVAPPGAIIVYLGPGDTVPLVLVRIAAGVPFMMGAPSGERGSGPDEMPQHQVTIARDYYLGMYEVTQEQWEAVKGTNPARFFGVGPDYPVYDVSWSDIAGASGFIERLNQAQGTTRFRLPTEAEWEYAARAGTTTAFPFPAPAGWDTGCGGFPAAEPHMWWCGSSGSTAHPVGERLANPWGLFDMDGNAWEWVQDWWHDAYTGNPPADGSAWLTPASPTRVLRGGSWHSVASSCRPAERYSYYPDTWGHGILGFRLAMSE